MKRVVAGCIFQTLVFSQKEELGLSKDEMLKLNQEELKKYKDGLTNSKTRHIITSEEIMPNGSISIKIRKQYNDTAEINEYFDL
jgi:hypothetical protein